MELNPQWSPPLIKIIKYRLAETRGLWRMFQFFGVYLAEIDFFHCKKAVYAQMEAPSTSNSNCSFSIVFRVVIVTGTAPATFINILIQNACSAIVILPSIDFLFHLSLLLFEAHVKSRRMCGAKCECECVSLRGQVHFTVEQNERKEQNCCCKIRMLFSLFVCHAQCSTLNARSNKCPAIVLLFPFIRFMSSNVCDN